MYDLQVEVLEKTEEIEKLKAQLRHAEALRAEENKLHADSLLRQKTEQIKKLEAQLRHTEALRVEENKLHVDSLARHKQIWEKSRKAKDKESGWHAFPLTL